MSQHKGLITWTLKDFCLSSLTGKDMMQKVRMRIDLEKSSNYLLNVCSREPSPPRVFAKKTSELRCKSLESSETRSEKGAAAPPAAGSVGRARSKEGVMTRLNKRVATAFLGDFPQRRCGKTS